MKFIKFLKSKQVLVKIKYQHIINILFPKDLYEVHQKIDIYINIYFWKHAKLMIFKKIKY